MSEFDPYHEWLGIQPHEHPVDHYRLLGLERFEADVTRIGAAVDQRITYLRSLQSGPRGIHTQELLNRLVQAQSCLLNPQSKADYDQQLLGPTRASPPTAAPLPTPSKVAYGAPPPQPPSQFAGPSSPLAGAPVVQVAPVVSPLPSPATPSAPPPKSQEDDTERDSRTFVRIWVPAFLLAGVALVATLVWAVGTAVKIRANKKKAKKAVPEVVVKIPDTPVKEVTGSRPRAMQELNGTVHFSALPAQLTGQGLGFVNDDEGGAVQGWNSTSQMASWDFRITRPFYFQLDITYATPSDPQGAVMLLSIGDQSKKVELRGSGGANEFITDSFYFMIKRAGDYQLVLRPMSDSKTPQMSLRSLQLTPKRK